MFCKSALVYVGEGVFVSVQLLFSIDKGGSGGECVPFAYFCVLAVL